MGYIRAWQAGVAFLYDPRNRDVAEALLVANIRAMSPQLAKQSLQVLLDERTGFFKDPALDLKGVATVLALRSKFAEPRKSLTDPSKYVDSSYVEKARKP